MKNAIPLAGRRFGRWTVNRRAANASNAVRSARWECACDCGTERVVMANSLLRGKSTNCGCVRRETIAARNLKHGHSLRGKETATYRVWKHMLQRCTNTRSKDFPYYGGRGIAVCSQWLHSFDTFLADMGERPSALLSIDRIDVNGNYEPGNCRWATRVVQTANRRRPARYGAEKLITQRVAA